MSLDSFDLKLRSMLLDREWGALESSISSPPTLGDFAGVNDMASLGASAGTELDEEVGRCGQPVPMLIEDQAVRTPKVG
ncbi:hypothetical protein D3C78_1687060 [compost metagenome]